MVKGGEKLNLRRRASGLAPEVRIGITKNCIVWEGCRTPPGQARRLASSLPIPIREGPRHLLGRIRRAIDFDIGVNEEVQRRTVLARRQVDIAASRELNAVFGQVAEVVFLELGIAIGLG